MKKIGRSVVTALVPKKAARLEVGAQDVEGVGKVYLAVGETTLYLTPERAEELAVDLRSYAIEVRNGGGMSA